MAGDVDSLGDTLAATDTVAATDTKVETTGSPAGRLSLADYEIGAQLGRGGMGEVLLARDPVIEREVAIKRMVIDGDPVAVARFLREAKIQARLEHPAIVPVHQIGTDEQGRPFFAMKKLAGKTLAEVLAAPVAKPQKLLRALIDVCNAIELAHSRSIIHRDLKPANIMLGPFGEVYVLDWGIARVVGGADGVSSSGLPASGETQVGSTMGTLGYMAPEQLRDASTAGPAADVYAIGCILYEILAGVAVHPRGAEAMTSTLLDELRSPATRAPDRGIAPELDGLCMAALAFEPHARPTAGELARKLENYLDGDRDLEHRRKLSAEHLAAARTALADPSARELAARQAGRALALDPDSEAAAQLVNEIAFQPPADLVLAPDLAAKLAGIDREMSRRSAGAASIMMLAYALTVPVYLINGIDSWPWLIAISAATFGITGFAQYQARSGRANDYAAMVGLLVLCIVVSRFGGVFLVMPQIVMIAMMGLGQQATFARHPLPLIATGLGAFVIPLLLESAGVFDRTFSVERGRLVIESPVLHVEGVTSFMALLVPSLLFTVAAVLFARKIASDRRGDLRKVEISAWHLARLIGVKSQ